MGVVLITKTVMNAVIQCKQKTSLSESDEIVSVNFILYLSHVRIHAVSS